MLLDRLTGVPQYSFTTYGINNGKMNITGLSGPTYGVKLLRITQLRISECGG